MVCFLEYLSIKFIYFVLSFLSTYLQIDGFWLRCFLPMFLFDLFTYIYICIYMLLLILLHLFLLAFVLFDFDL